MSRVRTTALAGAALIVGAQAAAAADLPPIIQKAPPAPIVEFGGWYLRGDIGFSNQSVHDVRFVAVDGSIPAQQNLTKGFDSAGIFGLGVGYQFNPWLRADVSGQYRTKAHFQGVNSVDQGGGVFLAESDFGSKSEWVVLANVYADLGTWWCLTPFIGAGVGGAYNIISNFQDSTVVVDSRNFGTGTGTWNFAWALHAGVAYKVTPGFSVELAYHYLDLGNASSGPLFAGYSPLGAPEGSNQFHHITSHDVTLGVRWLFSPLPPPEPLYPLVRKG
jgi:opacity protein-like surface antigen